MMMTKSTILGLALASLSAATSVMAQDAAAQTVPYCPDLQRVIELAMSKDRFASIAGSPGQGSFTETKLALPGWKSCSLYSTNTYTCDSPEVETAAAAERQQADLLQQMKTCLGEGWSEATDRSSANYVVLHHALRPVSITLSTDQTDDKKHIVHLILFVRGR
jgi:hypothetical protein